MEPTPPCIPQMDEVGAAAPAESKSRSRTRTPTRVTAQVHVPSWAKDDQTSKADRDIYTGQLAEIDRCCPKLMKYLKGMETADNVVADQLQVYQQKVERVTMSMDELRDRMRMVQRLRSSWC